MASDCEELMCCSTADCNEGGVDFFTALPLELVFQLVLYLELKQFLECLRVSKAWYHTLSAMTNYWRRACFKLGLSEETLSQLLAYPGASLKSVLYTALRHRHSIQGHPPTRGQLGSALAYNMHYTCQYAHGPVLVGTVYRDFKPQRLLMQYVGEETVAVTHLLQLAFPRMAENRLIWAWPYSHYLFCASASGVWCVYDVAAPTATATSVAGNVQTSIVSGPLLQWRAEPMYDPETRITCCGECGLICSAKLVPPGASERSWWELRVVEVSTEAVQAGRKKWRLPLPTVTKFTLEVNNREISSRRTALGKKKVALVPDSTEKKVGGRFCRSHLLLLQWANDVSGYALSYRTEEKRSVLNLPPAVLRSFVVEYSEGALLAAVTRSDGLNSEFALSEDGSLAGMIFQSHLVTWDATSSRSKRLSCVEIVLDSYQYEEMRLVSLGRVCSVVGLEFSCCMLVVATSTGEQLLRCAGFAENHCHLHPPYISFFSAVEEAWQSDMTRPCRTKVVYWNKSRNAVEWVGLGKPPGMNPHHPAAKHQVTNQESRRKWWQRK